MIKASFTLLSLAALGGAFAAALTVPPQNWALFMPMALASVVFAILGRC